MENYKNRPMAFSSEVESAVRMAGLADLDLAHGAGIIADAPKFRMLVPDKNAMPARRSIYGVTALSLSHEGEVTFRTATFGITEPTLINHVDALGTNDVIKLGVATDGNPRSASIASSKFVLLGLYHATQEHGSCTLGGTIIHAGEVENPLVVRPFISTALDEQLEKQTQRRTGRIGAAIGHALSPKAREARQKMKEIGGPSPAELQKLCIYALVASSAKKRGGPVVVERPLVALV